MTTMATRSAAAWRQAVQIKDIIPSDYNWLEKSSPFQHPENVPNSPVDYTVHNNEPSGAWFHVSPRPLAPGTRLTPGGGSGLHDTAPGEWGGENPMRNRRNHVWIAPNYTKAKFWHSQFGPDARIYEVKPGDKPQRWNYTGTEGWVVPHAHVVRDVTPTRRERRAPLDWQQSVDETYATGIPGRYNTGRVAAEESLPAHLHMSTTALGHYRQKPPRGQSAQPSQELLQDIAQNGVRNPVRIMTDGERGILDDGNHRLEAAERLGLPHLPVHVEHVPPIVMDNLRGNPRLKKTEPELTKWLQGRISSLAPWRVAAAHPPLSQLWKDFSDWHHEIHGDDPGWTPHDEVQGWGGVQEYLQDRHGLQAADPATYDHPVTFGMAKLHSLAQSRPQVDGYDYDLDDNDLASGAALGLLKIRKNQQNKLEPVTEEEEHIARLATQQPPEGLTFEQPQFSSTRVNAHLPGQPNVATIRWYHPDQWRESLPKHMHPVEGATPYSVAELDVHPDYRRQGIGSALFDYAKANVEPRLEHSTRLTPNGEAFARAHGFDPGDKLEQLPAYGHQAMHMRAATAWRLSGRPS